MKNLTILSIVSLLLCCTVLALPQNKDLYINFDISDMLPEFKNFPVITAGVFNTVIAGFTTNLIIPDNITSCILTWYTLKEDNEPHDRYVTNVYGEQSELLTLSLDIPDEGEVPIGNDEFHVNLHCHAKDIVSRTHLQIQFYNNDKSVEYEGFTLTPRKECQRINYEKCTAYPEAHTPPSGQPEEFTVSTLQLDNINDNIDTLTFNLYRNEQRTTVIALQGVRNYVIREALIKEFQTSHPYRVNYPRSNDESDNGLFILSKYPVVRCDYKDFNGYEDKNGVVMAGINLNAHRTLFVIGSELPILGNETSISTLFAGVKDWILENIEEYRSTHVGYNVSVVVLGNTNFDSEEIHYDDLLELLNGVDTFTDKNEGKVPTFGDIRSSLIIQMKDNVLSNDMVIAASTASDISTVSAHKVVKTTFTWPATYEPAGDSSSMFTPVFILLGIIAMLLI